MSDLLSKDYVIELIKCCLSNNKVLEIASKHLKYEFLQTEAQKKVVKYIFESYVLQGTSPTLGMIAQAFSTNTDVIALLSRIKTLNIQGKDESILKAFEGFIKDLRFQAVLKKVADLYNASKPEEAVKVLAKESKEIEEFTLKDKYYVKVFEQFSERMEKRKLEAASEKHAAIKERLTTGVHEMDSFLHGGYRKGTSFLAMARSGAGKSTYLRWVALTNARLGKKVVVFQGEEPEKMSLDSIDAAWTSLTSDDVEDGYIPENMQASVAKVLREIKARGGEIILIANEQFNKMTIEECREKLIDIIKLNGPVDMVLFDYLEIFHAKGSYGNSESAERKRREDIAEKITNIAVEFNVVTGTATQAKDIEPEVYNKVDFVMRRTHASEFKNVVKPFSYFFTFNATDDEYKEQQLRIWIDKVRKHPGNKLIRIYQSRDNGRFYDAVATKQKIDTFTYAA